MKFDVAAEIRHMTHNLQTDYMRLNDFKSFDFRLLRSEFNVTKEAVDLEGTPNYIGSLGQGHFLVSQLGMGVQVHSSLLPRPKVLDTNRKAC